MNNSQELRPLARRDGLVIQELPDEILVYDLETNKAHCLNWTAAFVWKACDGAASVADIARGFGIQTGEPRPESLVWLAIDQLSENRLLAEHLKVDFGGQSRRALIKKIGLAAVVALPIVSTLVAPTAASAVACSSGTTNCSGCADGTTCSCPSGSTNATGSCLANA